MNLVNAKLRAGSIGALLAGLFAMMAIAFAGPAAAHSVLRESTPAKGASLDKSPGVVSLTFNEDIQPEYALLKVVGPDGHFWQQGDPTVDGKVVSVPVGELGPVGEYTVNYRVTSADGHKITGQHTFTLTVAGHGQAGELADANNDAHPTAATAGSKVWWFVGPAIAIVAIALLVLLLRARSAKSEDAAK